MQITNLIHKIGGTKIMRVSELVTIDEINKWKNGDIVTISAGTGAGKSYFIKNNLYAIAKRDNKKILFLIHRTNCVNQFQMEIERDKKTDVIDIKTYQKIEYDIRKKGTFDFSPYKYIVSDEYHYFVESDAVFNKFTDMSLNAILSQSDKIRVFMSATADMTKRYINAFEKLETIDYELAKSSNAIDSLIFFNKDETMEEFCHLAIKKNLKTIFFIESAEKAYELYKQFKEYAIFNCSKSNAKYYKYVNEEQINNTLQNEKFDKLIFITTMAMSTGVNIIDTDLKHIVCDVKDTATLIQCIGRKRIQNDNDRFNLCIKAISNQQLGGMETQISKKIEMAEYFKKNGIDKYLLEYPRANDYSNITYDVIENGQLVKKLNMLMYSKNLVDIANIQSMLGKLGTRNLKIKYAYCKHIAKKLDKYDKDDNFYNYSIWEEEKDNNVLVTYLESIKGKKLLKDEQKELIEKIDVRINGRQQKTYKKLNDGLEMINLPFIIIPKRTKNERYWIVDEIER